MKKLIAVVLSLVGLLIAIPSAFAQGVVSPETGAEYSVVPHWAGQTDKQTGYFDLHVRPGQSENLGLTIRNMGQKAHVYQISVHTATTNKNQIVDYTMDNFTKDASMKFSLKELVQPQVQEVTVEAGNLKEVKLHLQVPQQAFSGILLGGVTVQAKEEAGQSGIRNVFMHTIALRLQEGGAVPAKLTAEKAEFKHENGHDQVSVGMHNPVGKLMTEVTGSLKVKNKESGKILATKELKNLSFAPNSCFDLPFVLKDSLTAGQYSYLIELQNRDGKFNFTKDFEVKATASNKNRTNKNLPATSLLKGRDWWLGALVVVIGLLALLVTYRVKNGSKAPK